MIHSRKKRLAVLALQLSATLAGCRDSRRRPASDWKAQPGPVTVGSVTLDERAVPKQVASALLDLIRAKIAVQHAGLGDPRRAEEFDSIRTQIRRLAAPNAVFAAALNDRFRMMPHGLTPERAVEIVSDQWASVVAYYIDGAKEESAVERQEGPDRITVMIPAANPADQSALDAIRLRLGDRRDKRGEPMRSGSPAFEEQFRREALTAGISPRPGAKIEITVTRESNYWRVARVAVGPGGDSSPSAVSQPPIPAG